MATGSVSAAWDSGYLLKGAHLVIVIGAHWPTTRLQSLGFDSYLGHVLISYPNLSPLFLCLYNLL